jgi:hypothetical protein
VLQNQIIIKLLFSPLVRELHPAKFKSIMKSRLIIIGLIISQFSFSQSELDKVVNGSCACITESTADVFDYDSYLSLIMDCASPLIIQNTNELARELGITEKDEMAAIEQIGSKVGERLVVECEQFTELTFKILGEDSEMMNDVIEEIKEDETEDFLIEQGTILSISNEIPCLITMRNSQDETLNFYWMEPININEQFVTNPDSLKGKKVMIVFYLGEVHNPKIGAYQARKILTELTVE